jgi:hypothetical protein
MGAQMTNEVPLLTANLARELLRVLGPKLVRIPGVMTYVEECLTAIVDGRAAVIETPPKGDDEIGPAGIPMAPALFFSDNFLAGARLEAQYFAESTAKANPSWFPATVGEVAINMQLLAEKVARMYAAPSAAPPEAETAANAALGALLATVADTVRAIRSREFGGYGGLKYADLLDAATQAYFAASPPSAQQAPPPAPEQK